MSEKKTSKESRRKFLKMLGITGMALTTDDAISQIKVVNPSIFKAVAKQGTIHIQLTRPQDLLSLELRFLNFEIKNQVLIKKADPAYMMVLFQPQSIAETCGTETIQNGNDTLSPPVFPAKLQMAYKSRLVFKITRNSINLNAGDLLNWENYELVVNSRAKDVSRKRFEGVTNDIFTKSIEDLIKSKKINIKNVGSIKNLSKKDKNYLNQIITNDENRVISNATIISKILMQDAVQEPGLWETALEIPYRLQISPVKNAQWVHHVKLKTDSGILKSTNQLFELWHTRLAAKTKLGGDDSDMSFEQRVLRVLWGSKIDKDFKNIPLDMADPVMGLTSMNDKDRHQLVHESSNFLIPDFVPQPVRAYKLFLTALGGYLDSIFTVDFKKKQKAKLNLSILKWRHIQTLAREHYVEIVEAGYIMPFGHEAVLIEITERKPHKASATASNFMRRLVVITEVSKDYDYRDTGGNFLNFCFNKITFITTASPLIDIAINTNKPFKIVSDNKNVPFNILGTDINGNEINFSLPLTFISNTILHPNSVQDFVKDYMQDMYSSKVTNFNGQSLSLAANAKNAVTTTFPTYQVHFGVQLYANELEEPQGFLPIMSEAYIVESSYQNMTGDKEPVSVSLEDDQNEGHVFAKFNYAKAINFAGNVVKTGGFAMPNFNLSGLSKAAGAFGGDLNDFKKQGLSAASYFTSLGGMPDPSLFGVFKLSDIINFANDKKGYDLNFSLSERLSSKIPNLSTTESDDQIITCYNLSTDLNDFSVATGSVKLVSFKPTKTDGLSIKTQAIINKGKDGMPIVVVPDFKTEATIKAFDIELMNQLIAIRFASISFSVYPGKSADISVNMKSPCMVFGGPLSFVNAFNSLIPSDGFYDPPYLDVSMTGVKCGYTLSLPDLQLGAFSLAHLSLSAEVNLPFTGAPMVMGFRFCEKQQPFTLQISFLGGGGYFGVEADLHGLRQIDAALEFGACASINLGVASGAASIMAGIYFKMTMDAGSTSTQLTGYLRINGALSILGLITASIELYMALSYLIDKNKVFGEASVSVKISIAFFSKTVSVHTSRTFAGSGNDPNFQMGYSKDQWNYYCESFAN